MISGMNMYENGKCWKIVAATDYSQRNFFTSWTSSIEANSNESCLSGGFFFSSYTKYKKFQIRFFVVFPRPPPNFNGGHKHVKKIKIGKCFHFIFWQIFGIYTKECISFRCYLEPQMRKKKTKLNHRHSTMNEQWWHANFLQSRER